MKTKIYLACFGGGFRASEVIGYALGEDGQGLASHISSNVAFSKLDMGLTSDWKHEHYAKVYPDGYELIWIDEPDTDERWLKAIELNKARPKDEHKEQQASVKVTFTDMNINTTKEAQHTYIKEIT